MIFDIVSFFDSTFLKTKEHAGLTEDEYLKLIESFVLEAIHYNFKLVMIRANYIVFAKENNITGRVFVSFVVDKTGIVTNVKILRGVDKYLDAEALRVVSSLPRFTPGKQRGKSVKVQYNVPISFKLN